MLVATIHFTDGTTESIPNVDQAMHEWIHEELDESQSHKGIYLPRTDGATVMKRDGVRRIDVLTAGQ